MNKKKLIVAVISIMFILFLFLFLGVSNYYRMIGKTSDIENSREYIEESTVNIESDVPEKEEDSFEELKKNTERNLAELANTSSFKSRDIINILILGIDSRNHDYNGNSDTIIVATLDKTNKKLILTSILRDIYLYIPGKGNHRINAAYAMGGTSLIKKTLLDNFGIKIDNCVVTNFSSVEKLIDSAGGVDIDMTAKEIEWMNLYAHEQNKIDGRDPMQDLLLTYEPGVHHLNGNQALAFARNRKIGTDFKRTERQRLVIEKTLGKIKDMNIVELDKIARENLKNVYTDLSFGDLASLTTVLVDSKNYELDKFTLPISSGYRDVKIKGQDVLLINFDKNIDAWRKKVLGSDDEINPEIMSKIVNFRAIETYDKRKKASESMEEASGSVEETSGSIEETSGSIEETSGSMEETSGSMEETSGSMEETSGSVEETSGSIEETSESVEIGPGVNLKETSGTRDETEESSGDATVVDNETSGIDQTS